MKKAGFILCSILCLVASGLQADWGSETCLTQWSVGGSWTSPNNARCLATSGDSVFLFWHDFRMGPAANRGCRIFMKIFDGSSWSGDILIGAFRNSAFHNWNASCVVDQNGRLHVVWESNDVNFPDKGNYDIVHRSRYNNLWAPETTKLTTHPQFSWHPVIAAGPGNRLDVFWQDNREGGFKIYRRMFDGTAWQAEHCLSPLGLASGYPSAASSLGFPAVAWQDFRTGMSQIFFMAQGPGGWGGDSAVSHSTVGAYMPCLVADQAGNLHLAWEDYRDGNGEIYYRRLPANGAWEPEIRVTFDPSHSRGPVIVCRGDSLVDLFWADDRDGCYEIYTVQSKRGLWQNEQRLTFQQAASFWPAAAADARGNLHLVWTDMRGSQAYAPDIYHMSKMINPWPKSGPSRDPQVLLSRLSASPNPAKGAVVFQFGLERPMIGDAAILGIYDLTGRLVSRRIIQSPTLGLNSVFWDGRGQDGKRLACGVYLARLVADGQSASCRLVLLR